MRELCLAQLDKTRPVAVLTREAARSAMTKVTVAPITTTIKGLSSEVPVGTHNGLQQDSVISLDNVLTYSGLSAWSIHWVLDVRAGSIAGPSDCPRPRPRYPAE